GQARTTVHLQYRPGLLTVQVDDDGAGNGGSGGGGATAPQPTSGMGLIGMRERVSALGGSLDAGPRAGGGFRVRAELPARAAS
ncbi:MAG: sensor histidine kinase, partial [Trebonia sp.]